MKIKPFRGTNPVNNFISVLILFGISMVIMIIFLFLVNFYKSLFMPPQIIEQASDLIDDSEEMDFVRNIVIKDGAFPAHDTGYSAKATNTDYVLFEISDGQYLLASVGTDGAKGQWATMANNKDAVTVLQNLSADMNIDFDLFTESVVPFMLKAQTFSDKYNPYMFMCFLLFSFITFFSGGIKSLILLFSPSKAPVYKRLADLGGYEEINEKIDARIANPLLIFYPSLVISEDMIIMPGSREAAYINDILMVYVKYQGNTSTIKMLLKDKRFMQTGNMRDNDIKEVMNWMERHYPWMIIGFEKKYYDMFRRSNSKLIDIIEARKEKYKNAINDMEEAE